MDNPNEIIKKAIEYEEIKRINIIFILFRFIIRPSIHRCNNRIPESIRTDGITPGK